MKQIKKSRRIRIGNLLVGFVSVLYGVIAFSFFMYEFVPIALGQQYNGLPNVSVISFPRLVLRLVLLGFSGILALSIGTAFLRRDKIFLRRDKI